MIWAAGTAPSSTEPRLRDETILKPGDTFTVGPMTFELEGADPARAAARAASAKNRKPLDPKASDDDIAIG